MFRPALKGKTGLRPSKEGGGEKFALINVVVSGAEEKEVKGEAEVVEVTTTTTSPRAFGGLLGDVCEGEQQDCRWPFL